MADITGPLPGGSGPLPKAPTGNIKPAAPAEPQPKVGTDALSLSQPAAEEPKYFGHAPKVTLSLFMKQPIWADTREAITGDQWAQMPKSQQDAILKLIPTEPAKAQFLSGVDPAVMKAKAELSAQVKAGWEKAQAWAGNRPEPTKAQTEATLDKLAEME